MLESLAKRFGSRLEALGLRLAVAESCTGGWIAKSVTDVAGSSVWFDGGVVSYSNTLKSRLLGIDPKLIERHGAVSEPVARAMVEGLAKQSDAEVGIAVTGVAGPGGGTAEKPVGLVWFAWRVRGRIVTESRLFDGNRRAVRASTVAHALENLLELLDRR